MSFLGVVSTETEIWFFLKGVKISNFKKKKIEFEIEFEIKKNLSKIKKILK
jgi:hypothetical protein